MVIERVDCAVIGAGVVGLAAARALARAGREVVVLEAEDAFGTQTSARNSEVIHAGIGYAPGSLKAQLCVAGRRALYAYCAERGVAHRRIGKLLVVLDEAERPELERLRRVAAAEGVDDLRPLEAADARALEPEVQCVAALWSPSTGIVDSHALMLAYLGDAEAAGATLALRSPVLRGRAGGDDGIVLEVGGDEPMTIACRSVVNAAGLQAQAVARAIDGVPAATIPPLHYAIGHYYTLAGRAPFTHLVYPVDRAGALRAHATIDLGGQCKFGPDLRWIERIDYRFDDSRRDDFARAIRRWWPALPDDALQPGYTGIRPRLAGPGDSLHHSATDFVIQGAATHGIAGLVNLYGIESPGLTASLAIGEHVAALLAQA